MSRLEVYDPLLGSPAENLRVQRLLDMARGIGDRGVATPAEVTRELGHYAQYNGGAHGVFHVARDEQTIGALTHTAWFRDSLQFNAITVAPEYRGQGVARRIIFTLAQAAMARDIDDLWVYAMRGSHASEVYAHLGMSVPPLSDERHPHHSRYHPMSASPRRVVERAEGTEPFELIVPLSAYGFTSQTKADRV